MRSLSVAVVTAISCAALVLTSAQGSPVAKKTATIPTPAKGNATVAHLVLRATPKKGKKPKKAVKRPKLKVLKAPAGVVVAASFKRDAKKKNVWHATVVMTNPVTTPLRLASSNIRDAQESAVLVTVIETDDAYIFVFTEVEIEEDVTFQEMPVPPWMAMDCDPSGSGGDTFLFGPPPAGVSPNEFIDYGCSLGMDGPIDFDVYPELGLAGLVFDLDPFPATRSSTTRSSPASHQPIQRRSDHAPPGHNVTALLPPTGGFGATKSGTTATFGTANNPSSPDRCTGPTSATTRRSPPRTC
jgi:hypothetical protein